MRLRKADCGHWIPDSLEPAGTTANGEQVYLCFDCRDTARRHEMRSRLITKTQDRA